MIIHGGEPPFIENPEPSLGEVLLKLDEIAYSVEQSVHSFNDGTKQAIILFSQNLAGFIADVVTPIDAHVNKVGAAHGETKATVGLSKKDNYRTATLAEQVGSVPVKAYVTPQGAWQAFANRNANNPFVKDDYQQNDVLQLASYYYVNEFPVLVPTVVQPVRYFQGGQPVGMVINEDRIVYSPISRAGVYQTEVGFISAPTNSRRSSRLAEIINLETRFESLGWNNIGAVTPDGRVTLFKPLADKKIFLYGSELNIGGGPKGFLLFSNYVGSVYTGVAIRPRVDNDTAFSIEHRFFKVDAFETNPTLRDSVTDAYPALFTMMTGSPFQSPLQFGQTNDIRNFINTLPGQTIKIGAENGVAKVTVAAMWASEDYEIYLNVSVPVVVENGSGNKKYLLLNFMVSIIPGTMVAGGSATVTILGTRIKDSLNNAMLPVAGSKYLRVTDTWDFNCPSNLPGVVLSSGDVLRSITTRNGIRIKRYPSGFAGLQAWLQADRPRVDARNARTEMYAPARHSPFGVVPERIIPITNLNGVTRYLIYGLDNERGYYRWEELSWSSESVIGSVTGALFGIKSPTVSVPYPSLDRFPRGLAIYANKSAGGFGFNPLVFTTENGYKAQSSFQYSEGVVTPGSTVTLANVTLIQLQALSSKVMTNAKAFNPAIPVGARAAQIQVYALEQSKAVVVITDGVSYAEGAVVPYTVTNGVFQLTFVGNTGISLYRLTPASNSLIGRNRVSKSGDGPWSTPSDLLASRIDVNTYNVVVTRPFGELYGDLSFNISSFSSNTPIMTPGAVNPARLFNGVSTIDAVDALYPPILLPNKGVYQATPGGEGVSSPMNEVGGNTTVDPYNINEAGWVFLPSGSRVVLLGRTHILKRDYPIKVNPNGVSYCYLQRNGAALVAFSSDLKREVTNGEVLIGTSTNGILTVNESYVVMDRHVLSASRHGSSIPVFDDNGGLGVNRFFTQRDVG